MMIKFYKTEKPTKASPGYDPLEALGDLENNPFLPFGKVSQFLLDVSCVLTWVLLFAAGTFAITFATFFFLFVAF